MFHSKMAVAAIALAASIPGTALADAGHGRTDKTMTNCPGQGATELQSADLPALAEHRIVSVAPYYEEQTNIKRTWKELRGATIRIQAEPGLTPEWLQLQLERRAAALSASSTPTDNDPLAVAGVHPRVSSATDGFVVRLAAQDKHAGEEVLRRTEALQERAH